MRAGKGGQEQTGQKQQARADQDDLFDSDAGRLVRVGAQNGLKDGRDQAGYGQDQSDLAVGVALSQKIDAGKTQDNGKAYPVAAGDQAVEGGHGTILCG